MLDHHIQRAIVYKLALSNGLKFSELKPSELENKLFDYHLKKTIAAKFVEKLDDGTYALTPEGRRLGVHLLENVHALMDRALSVLFLVVRRKSDNAWLLYRRNNHPLKDKVGFMHATPNASEDVCTTASKVCLERTGLNCQFLVAGSGYFRIYEGDELESFTHFTLLSSEDAKGELIQNDRLAEYEWVDTIDFNNPNLLPNMKILTENYLKNKLFFIDETIRF